MQKKLIDNYKVDKIKYALVIKKKKYKLKTLFIDYS